MGESARFPFALEKGEVEVRRLEEVKLNVTKPRDGFWQRDILLHTTGLLILTNQRLIHYATSPPDALGTVFEVVLTDILECNVKKPTFGEKYLALKARLVSWKHRGSAEAVIFEPLGNLVLWNIEQLESLKAEIRKA